MLRHLLILLAACGYATIAFSSEPPLKVGVVLNPARVIFEKKSLAIAGRAQSWRSQVAP